MVRRGWEHGVRAWCAPLCTVMVAALLVPVAEARAGAQPTAAASGYHQQAELTSKDGAQSDNFGQSVAVSGDTMVVGAPFHGSAGALYVFSDTSGTWTQTAELTGTGTLTPRDLGESVAITGGAIVASAPGTAVGANNAQGALYVFSDTSGKWTQTAVLTASDGAANDQLGGGSRTAVAISGSTIVAGAANHTVGTDTNQGEVYAFTSSAGVWAQSATLLANDPDDSAPNLYPILFGASVAVSGGTIVVGAPGQQVGQVLDEGEAYIFTGSGSSWTVSSNLLAADRPTVHNSYGYEDEFGDSVAMDGSTIVIGAGGHGTNKNGTSMDPSNDVGAVYLFSGATQTGELLANDPDSAQDQLGEAVAISGNTIVASAPRKTVGSNQIQGVAYVFTGGPGAWTQAAEVTPNNANSGFSYFGEAVGVSGSTVVAGATNTEVGTNLDQGAVYVFGSGLTVSGTVFGHACRDNGNCLAPSGLGGVQVLVTGTATDSTPVSVTATTAPDGTWSVTVPPGTYTVGPTVDGTSIFDGPSFEPHDYPSVTVGASSVTDRNFSTCVEQSESKDKLVAAGTRLRIGAVPSSAGEAVSGCVSQYTVTIKSSIHQSVLVDPSEIAHYNTKSDPGTPDYRSKQGWVGDYLRKGKVSRELAAAPEFPECDYFTADRVKQLTEERARVTWSSDINAATKLGTATVTLSYNQSTGHVELVSAPTVSREGILTRGFQWRMEKRDGKVTTGHCKEKAQVPMQMTPVLASMDGSKGKVDANAFTILAAWEFPFDPPGVTIDPEASVAQQVLTPLNELNEVIESNKVTAALKEIGFMVASHLVLGKLVAGIKALPRVLTALYEGELPSKFLAGLRAAGSTAAGLHHVQSLKEVIGFFAGVLGIGKKDEDYPVMAAVIRGKFSTQTIPRGPSEKVPVQTTLAVSALTTKFPKISLEISRQANDNPSFTTFQGPLPWKTGGDHYEDSDNPFFGSNPKGVLTTTAHEDYGSGKEALEHLRADISQAPAVAESLREHYALLSPLFGEEQDLAPEPACSEVPNNPIPSSQDTICWQFGDGRA